MENTTFTTLTRQSGLEREMTVLANNIANSSTTGFRQEGLVFSEFITRQHSAPSLSMAVANVQTFSTQQGALKLTGGTFDLAIEGQGFFLIETPNGNVLTRAGSFATNAASELTTADGYRVLDVGQAPVFVPPDATDFKISADGTISANGRAISQIGVYQPIEGETLSRRSGVLLATKSEPIPAENAKILQGYLEGSNVDPISQMARIIEVQRAYEMGQSFLEAEHERVRSALKSLIR